MKTRPIFAGLMMSTLLLLALMPAHAQVEQVTLESGKEVEQGELRDNDVATLTAPGKRLTMTTKTLLQDLALDETTAGNWFAKFPSKVPANAKLEVIYPGRGAFSSLSYKVVSGKNVVDVSNVLTASAANTGTNVIAQTLVDTNNLVQGPFSYTVYQEFTITYDSRPIGGGAFYQIMGLATCSAKAGKTNPKTGKFLETDSFQLIDGTGSGIDSHAASFIVSGVTVTASGSAEQEPLRITAGAEPTGVTDVNLLGGEWSDGAVDTEIFVTAQPELPLPASTPPAN